MCCLYLRLWSELWIIHVRLNHVNSAWFLHWILCRLLDLPCEVENIPPSHMNNTDFKSDYHMPHSSVYSLALLAWTPVCAPLWQHVFIHYFSVNLTNGIINIHLLTFYCWKLRFFVFFDKKTKNIRHEECQEIIFLTLSSQIFHTSYCLVAF